MTLDRQQARRFYDRFGARQDRQGWYEDPPLDRLLEHSDFERASSVVELGCGTGRVAARLLAERLPPSATYRGFDSSPTMVALARARLAPWGDRASVELTEGDPALSRAGAGFDRYLSTWVIDLLSEADIATALDGAARLVGPGGRLCFAGLTPGPTPFSRLVSSLWRTVHRLRPALVGGCRPLEIAERLDRDRWRLSHRSVVVARGIASEVLVAERRTAAPGPPGRDSPGPAPAG